MRYISNVTSAARFISELREFDGSSMSGRRFWHGGTGRLPINWQRVIREQEQHRPIEYVVYSFATPIAWLHDGAWYVLGVTYSGYSLRHQSFTRHGIHAWMDNRGLSYVDPINVVRADEWAHYVEILHARENKRALPIHRRSIWGTSRVVRPGRWVQDGEFWRRIYSKSKSADGTWFAHVGLNDRIPFDPELVQVLAD